ncbi:MAG: hypothetical protein RJA70_3672 [Pseudomonadota bacterium]
MTTAVVIDGELVGAGQAKVSVFDRGFLYGDSVFETVRTYGGRPFALGEHLRRLKASADKVFIALPLALEALEAEVERAIAKAGNAESYIRIMLTRGQGSLGLDPTLADVPLRVILVQPLSVLPASLYETGAAAVSYKTLRPADATLAEGAKIGNYLVAVLGTRLARQAGAHEALILDAEERVVEGASSNLFYVREGGLYTPPVRAGILAGITRERTLRAAEALSLSVHFELPKLHELLAADEVFISSSIRELLPIVRIDSEPIGDGQPGRLTRLLHAEFKRVVEREMALAVVA